MGSQFSWPDAALPDLRAYLEQQKLRAYLGQQKLALVREAKQPRQDIIKAALAKTLALAFAECRLLGFDSGAPWCPHRVERRASPQFVSRLFDDYARQFEPMRPVSAANAAVPSAFFVAALVASQDSGLAMSL